MVKPIDYVLYCYTTKLVISQLSYRAHFVFGVGGIAMLQGHPLCPLPSHCKHKMYLLWHRLGMDEMGGPPTWMLQY